MASAQLSKPASVKENWSDMSCSEFFKIETLDEPGLKKLYHEATCYGNLSGILVVPDGTHDLGIDDTPAELRSSEGGNKYTIYFVNKLNRTERIMAIGHELGHLLLIGKYGLISPPEVQFLLDNEAQVTIRTIQDVTHHLILVDLLREEFGIHSDLHLDLIRNNLGDYLSDTELLQQVKALRVFEYKKLIGNMEEIISVSDQGESFQKTYVSAVTRFGEYDFEHIFSLPDHYKENMISFLMDIGYIGKGGKTQ